MSNTYSQWYPYHRIYDGYLDGAEEDVILRKLCDYLIDAPNGAYEPKDDNSYSRCRLWKYLYHDGAKPLEQPLPTIQQKMSVVFNPNNPANPPSEKGYRLIPQRYIKQAQENAQTRVFVGLGRVIAHDEFKMYVAVHFDIISHYTYESNTASEAYSRTVAIERALIEALHGVNMAGVGTFYISKSAHPDCGGSEGYDETNVYRRFTFAIEIGTTSKQSFAESNNQIAFADNPNLKLA